MTLPESPVGEQSRLTAPYALRLNEMGTRCGSLAHVTGQAAFGGRIVAVAGSRYGLAAKTAALIEVKPVTSLP